MAKNWHKYDISSLAKELNTNLSDGLSPREAAVRLDKYKKKSKGVKWSLFVSQRSGNILSLFDLFINPFALTQLALSVFALCFGKTMLGLFALVVSLVAIAIAGAMSKSSAETLEEMKNYASPMVRVKRGGSIFHIDGRNLVCGDLIIVAKGDLLPCDARIVESEGLAVDEFYRENGKTVRRRVRKSADIDFDHDSAIEAPDAHNMIYAGSAICEGAALCIVVEVGEDVYLGEFAECGSFGDKDGDPVVVKNLSFEVRRASVFCVAGLALVSLVALVTLGKSADIFFIFTNLLSSLFFVSARLPEFGSREIFSSYIARAKRRSISKKKRKDPAYIRNVKSLDTLSGITDLVLLGGAGLSHGDLKAEEIFIPVLGSVTPDDHEKLRYVSQLLYTYVKAKREKNHEITDTADHISDAAHKFLLDNGFDASGTDMTLRDLSYSYDVKIGHFFAYAETDTRFSRVGLIDDRNALELCDFVRDGDGLRELTESDVAKINENYDKTDRESLISVALISESENKTVFEALIVFKRMADADFSIAAEKLESFGVKTTVLLDNDRSSSLRLLSDDAVSHYVDDKIAYADDFRKDSLSILHGIGAYKAYVGFDNEEYALLLREMKKNGAVIAAFGISDSFNEVMASANLGITSDVVAYSGIKFRESVYEHLPAEGGDDCVRASQRTRLLSKVIIPRSGERGGGISCIFRALRLSRAAHISYAHSMLLFVLLMAPLLTFTLMSPLTGNVLLDPLMTIALSSCIALLSFKAFSDAEPSEIMLSQKRDLKIYALKLIKDNKPKIIALAASAFATSFVAMTLGLAGIFGSAPAYTLPIYLCMIFTVVFEMLAVRKRLVAFRDGKGRVNLKLVVSLVLLLIVAAIPMLKPFSAEFYKNGFGKYEFLLLPIYIFTYLVSKLIARMQKK